MQVLVAKRALILSRFVVFLFTLLGLGQYADAAPGDIITIAGGGSGDGGVATSAIIRSGYGIALDSSGNLYIADCGDNRVRKITPDGFITTIAGIGGAGYSGDGGPATSANLSCPSGVAVSNEGDIFIADQYNHRIRKVDQDGIITTVAGNGVAGFSGDNDAAVLASLDRPFAVHVDSAGNLFIADMNNNRIRKVNSSGIIITVVGNGTSFYGGDGGPATQAALYYPTGVCADSSGSLYIADMNHHVIRKVDSVGIITTVAGNGTAGSTGDGGPATSASLYAPSGIFVDQFGNLFISDHSNRIRKVDASGIISTKTGTGQQGFAGDGGLAILADLNGPQGVAVSSSGDLYVLDSYNHRIRKIDVFGVITSIGGNGTAGYFGDGGLATAASLLTPNSVAMDAFGNIFIGDTNNSRIRRVSPSGTITTVAGNGDLLFSGDGGPAISAALYYPYGIAVDSLSNLYIADVFQSRIRKVDAIGVITTVAGNGAFGFSGDGGPATEATLNHAFHLATDTAGNIFIADKDNHRIRKVSSDGVITTIAGTGTAGFNGDGAAAAVANLNYPFTVAIDNAGSIFIADRGNHRIRKIDPYGAISTVAGNGTAGYSGDGGSALSASLNSPAGIFVDGIGNLYIADSANHRIRKVDATGIITTVAGNGTRGYYGDNGPATSASLYYPSAVFVDADGNILIADANNDRIRKVIRTLGPAGTINVNSGAEYTNTPYVSLSLSCTSPGGDCTEVQFSDDNAIWSTPAAYSATMSWALTPGDGTKTVYVRFKDSADTWSVAFSDLIILDTMAPTVEISSPATGTTNDSSPMLVYTVSDGTVTVLLDGVPVNVRTGERLSALTEGVHTLRVESTDGGYNTGSAIVTFSVDILPSISIALPSAGAINNTTPMLTYAASNGTVVVKVDGVVVNKVSGDTLDALADGPHIVRIEATDAGGTGFAERAFTVDTIAPSVTITSPAAGSTADNQPLLVYTASDGTVTVKVDGVVVNKVSGSRLDSLSNNTHTVAVEARDAAGNSGSAEVSFTVNAANGFADDLESGSVKWKSSSGLWHVVSGTSPYPQSHSPSHSWWYGQDATGNFNTGAANSGELISVPFTVPASAKLTFWSWEQTESSGSSYDTRKVYISTNNGGSWTQLFQSLDNTSTWHQVSIDLAAYANATAQLKFAFNTVDGVANTYRGWYLDDISVAYSAPLSPETFKNEGFETGNLNYLPWITSGNGLWAVRTTTKRSGLYAAEAPVSILDNQSATMEVIQNCAAGGISFWYSVSSEANYDFLRFYIDGVQKGQWSGTVPWTQASYPVTAGNHTFRWVYSKDVSVSSGSDTAWVDDIAIPVP